MLLLKGRKHCKGDLYLERHFGETGDLVCLQCGRRRTFEGRSAH